jgi:hypothetical protein
LGSCYNLDLASALITSFLLSIKIACALVSVISLSLKDKKRGLFVGTYLSVTRGGGIDFFISLTEGGRADDFGSLFKFETKSIISYFVTLDGGSSELIFKPNPAVLMSDAKEAL